MRAALAERVVPNAGRIVGGTFHSVAHRMVRAHASSLGLAPGFGVLDAGDAGDLLDFVRQEQRSRGEPPALSRARRRCSTSTRAPSTRRPRSRRCWPSRSPGVRSTATRWREIFRAYGARKRALSLLDLDDLLLYWRALAVDEVIGPRIAGDFDHVLVDEYQDVNGLQVDIVRGLRRAQPRPHGRRRRLPGDLRVSRRERPPHPRLPRAVPRHAHA